MASEQSNNNAPSALVRLLNQLNLPALVLILLFQGGNWWETKSGNDFNAREIEQATREIHDLYPKLDDAVRRQQRMQDTLDKLLAAQHTN